jgi:hypothetical protein
MPEWTKLRAQDWLEKRISEEGGTFWTDTERRDLCDQLAQKYRPGAGDWSVRREMEEGSRPVYVVVCGGLEIHTDPSEERAKVVARTLQGLDRAVTSGPG